MSILTIDIGGTYIKHACMSLKGEILSRGKFPTPKNSQKELVDEIGKLRESVTGIEGIAISMPGIIDSAKGYCHSGGSLKYNENSYFAREVEQRCQLRVSIENDAKCAVIAEAATGSLAGVDSGFVLIFGTGIGGGFVKDGRLLRGSHFAAGEVSFLVTERGTYPNANNIWGSCCGTPGLCRLYAQNKGIGPETVDGEKVFAAVNHGEPEAINALECYTTEIALQIYNLQIILDPELFSIGGGISAQPVFINSIRKSLDKIYSNCSLPVPRAKVVCCKYQNDANLYGALQTFLQNHP